MGGMPSSPRGAPARARPPARTIAVVRPLAVLAATAAAFVLALAAPAHAQPAEAANAYPGEKLVFWDDFDVR